MSVSPESLERLLRDICMEWGFCLDPNTYQRITTSAELTPTEFARLVVEAEGISAEGQDAWVGRLEKRFRDSLAH